MQGSVLREIMHLVTGLVAAAALTALFVWAYPQGRDEIRACGAGAMAAVVLMGLGPIRRAAK